MAERGTIGGLDFRFEQFPPTVQQPAMMGAQPPSQVQVPEYSNDPLAVREKLTSDYYNNMAALRSFVTDMSRQGIDPFQPDWTQDGGGLAFQTAKKLEAGLMFAANALSNEFQREKQVNDAVLRGDARVRSDFDPSTQLFTQTPDAVFSTQLDPRIAASNQRTAQNVYTQGDARNLNTATYDPARAAIMNDPTLTEEQKAYQLGGLFPAVAETNPYAFRPTTQRGLTQEDLSARAQLIKQVKSGILTNDQTPLNMIRLVPGVEDVEYVNTGDQVGLRVYLKGGASSFVDLTKGGEGEINAFLNRIEGQKNVPNEMVFQFDTKVDIPTSNARQVVDQVKTNVRSFNQDTIGKLQELAALRKLVTPEGEPIASVEIEGPYMGFLGGTDLVVTYYPVTNGKVNYNRQKTKKISSAADLDSLVETNSNQIAPAFGGGFVDQPQSAKTIKASDIPAKAAAAGYTPEEYTQLLQQRGIQITE